MLKEQKELLNKIKNKEFIKDLIISTEKNIHKRLGFECYEEKTIWDCLYKNPLYAQNASKIGQLFGDIYEKTFKQILDKYEIQNSQLNNNGSDFFINNIPFVMKSSRGKHGSFQGNIESNKCNNYILIRYKLNETQKLSYPLKNNDTEINELYTENRGLIEKFFMAIVFGINNNNWIASSHQLSHRTVLQIYKEDIPIIKKIKDGLCIGSLNIKNKLTFVPDDIYHLFSES
jgi:hypothetical protein